jgi:ribosome maturation factor RimP
LIENLAGTHLFLVSSDIRKNRIEIFIDGDCGVNINECAVLNRNLHRRLEEMNIDTGDYTIEISSPGFDRDLNDIRSFKKNVGRNLRIRNSQGKYIKGHLSYVDENGIILVQGNKSVGKSLTAYAEIKEAKVVI